MSLLQSSPGRVLHPIKSSANRISLCSEKHQETSRNIMLLQFEQRCHWPLSSSAEPKLDQDQQKETECQDLQCDFGYNASTFRCECIKKSASPSQCKMSNVFSKYINVYNLHHLPHSANKPRTVHVCGDRKEVSSSDRQWIIEYHDVFGFQAH